MIGRRWMGIVAMTLAVSAVPLNAAQAGHNGNGIVNGIFNIIGRAAAISHAREGWNATGADVQSCIVRRTNTRIETLVENAIGPDDRRLVPYIAACDQEIAQTRATAAQAAAARAAQAEADRRARLAAKAAAAAQKAQQEARHRALISKFGVATAAVIETGGVKVGMTKDEVIASKGVPQGKDVVPPNDELWHYASGDVSFTKGRVSYVGH